ncbi:PhoR [Desulfamplus magnetovallimortis]|uniref:histidine kinase n=1 Tax=Desulfamplus magnetovallimortis TaxID=1246637 RepID=A0A1W1H521_9BACT|nr:ATP-binding protein [Desulfamplus magnetovallimortis]SLM27571.1 PhoR [Desulfamplus magnetovallimortis]
MEHLDPGKILVIDDEPSLREGAKRILSKMDFEVFLAPRGEEGLEILQQEPIAIVLLDMKMPGMDGMEVLKRIMAMERGILVIVITGYATVETAIEAMQRGAYNFIPKPYQPDQLRISVSRAREKIELTIEKERLQREKKRTLEDLHNEQSRTRTIIESLPNGVIVTNSMGKVVLINPACYQYLGISEDKGPGLAIDNFIENRELCDLVIDLSRGRYIDYSDIPPHEIETENKNCLMVRCSPVMGERNECIGAVVNFVDITTMKALDQLKSEFVAKVTHELRSPLSTIHEQLNMVIDSIADKADEQDQYMLSRAREKTRTLISTIGDLLDLSRIEAGTQAKKTEKVQIDELLKNIGDFLNDRAKAKNQTLTVIPPETTIPPLTADPMALESVFGNLIANAINYTQEGGTIEVRSDVAGNNIRVSVKDNGFGIDAKYMDKIFDRFYRVKNDRTRFINGTGLGLPIVKGIVDAMKGYINVESEVDRGTTFTVILPLKSIPAGIM